MRTTSAFLLLLFTILSIRQSNAQESLTITRNLTIEVTEDSVGLWKIWQNNKDLLSQRFSGFIKYRPKQKDSGKLAETREYFANYVMLRNHHAKQLDCNRGFYRCLSPGTILDISISMHPWKTKREKNPTKINQIQVTRTKKHPHNEGAFLVFSHALGKDRSIFLQ